MFFTHYSFAVPVTIGLAIGAVLALLFCGMSCIFMKVKRKISGGKDDSEITNGENNKKVPKTGITYQKPIHRAMQCYENLFYHLPEFHTIYILSLS